ncbi:hypothetical protein DQ244_06525 [Blastococcus sp. TBT05-19]|uniref:hypothetical protein n=1 Tax=Blastococcus sp. TBT05-19 TaxID=2250581 RepID=UPI000DE97D4F|nr:hypothetical protein [Blastococcus sp. TBT05-19]RBY94897.1 hypothetical protein DQ244_06525 [Blastococcus sp. TBT05-19]
MRSDDYSWVISTEYALESDLEGGEGYHDPLWIRVVAIPDEHWLDRAFDNVRAVPGGPLQVNWDKHLLNIDLYAVHENASNTWIAASFVDDVLARSGGTWEYSRDLVTEGLVENTRIPVYGSPPQDWGKLGALLGIGGGLTGAGIVAGVGPEPSLTLVLIAGGATLFVNIVVPVSRAIGRGLEHRIDQLMGTPPRDTSALE